MKHSTPIIITLLKSLISIIRHARLFGMGIMNLKCSFPINHHVSFHLCLKWISSRDIVLRRGCFTWTFTRIFFLMPPRELFNLVSNYYHLWKHLYLVIMTTPFLTKTSTLHYYKYWTLYFKPGNSNPPDLTYAQCHIHLKIISHIFLTLLTHTHLTIVLLNTADASSLHILFHT